MPPVEGQRETFNFGSFQPDTLWEGGRLGTYLENGDVGQKQAYSDTLQLARYGQHLTRPLVP